MVAERPLRLAEPRVVLADQPLARTAVGGALEDRVVGEERVAGEIHLRDEPGRKAGAEHAEMDVRRPPGVRRVAPRVGAGLDGQKAVLAARARDYLAGAG